MSTEGVEGVGVELASDAIEDVPAKMDFSSSEREASEAAKTLSRVQRVDHVRLGSDNIRGWSGRVVVDFGSLDDRE